MNALSRFPHLETDPLWPAKERRLMVALERVIDALVLGGDTWAELPTFIGPALTDSEKGQVARAMLRGLPADVAHEWASSAFENEGLVPDIAVSVTEDAELRQRRDWARRQSQQTLKATLIATYEAAAPTTRKAFIDWIAAQHGAAS